MDITLVAQDFAYCQIAELLLAPLSRRGHNLHVYLAYGGRPKDLDDSLLRSLSKSIEASRVVLLGMSSSEALSAIERKAADLAISSGVPYGFCQDTYTVLDSPRSWLRPYYPKTSFVCVLNQHEANRVRSSFAEGVVTVTGNPVWERFFFPSVNRDIVRKTLGISNDAVVIQCPTSKLYARNRELIEATATVHRRLTRDNPNCTIVTLVTTHPGDSDYRNNATVYDELLLPGMHVIEKSVLSSSEILNGCNLVIQTTSTIGIEAAHLRIPVIDFFGPNTLVSTREWPPCDEFQISVRVDSDPKELSEQAKSLIVAGENHKLRRHQEMMFPKSDKPGDAVNRIISVLEDVGRDL